MYDGIPGIDDEEYLAQILGSTPLVEDQQVFQAQQPQAPALAQLLSTDGGTAQQLADMSEGGSGSANAEDMAQRLNQVAQSAGGQNRIAQQQQANQAAMQQSQQKGGGLLGSLLKIGANIALNKWIGGMFPTKKGA